MTDPKVLEAARELSSPCPHCKGTLRVNAYSYDPASDEMAWNGTTACRDDRHKYTAIAEALLAAEVTLQGRDRLKQKNRQLEARVATLEAGEKP